MSLTLVIAGPTASGKTELALALAGELGGEIVSADSRQIYRKLDAGTAKPSRDPSGRVGGIPYHLVDRVDPREDFDAGRFAAEARALCAEIRARGRVPILAGGTGLYLRAFLDGLAPLPGRDAAVRARFEELALKHGRPWLHARLAAADPEAAAKIPANNLQRVVRALEVRELTGRPISSFWTAGRGRLPAGTVALRIDWPAEALKARITGRAEAMWPGILAETRALLASGYDGSEPGFQSLGYREAVACARGLATPAEGLRGMIKATLAYAKRQRTWFSRQLPAEPIAGGPLASMLKSARAALSQAAKRHEASPA